MRRITLWLLSTVTVLVLLFSYRTSTMGISGSSSTAAVAPADTSGGTTASTGSAATPAPSSSSSSTTTASSGSGTYDGSVEQTRWGPVQVRITVANGKIIDVEATTYPDGNQRDIEINDRALPILHDEVLAAQSADINTVSGATVTSDGYITSLQAALDAAHLS
jgi:uncharacterized protein with FMN-binding domain